METKAAVSAEEHSAGSAPEALKKSEFPYIPPYINNGWTRFFDPNGYPAVKPPWGTLNAIDLNTGEYLWKVPLGEFPELTKKGIPITGTENYGGPIVTAGGLVFIAATKDERIRAFDKKTGEVLWEYQLPAGGFATPVTYQVNGKQYIAIAAGGVKNGHKPGGLYIAFALP
jgi:quinoprotein glucose dehydrogenase